MIRKFLLIYFIIKVFYMLISLFFISKYIQLGDLELYISGRFINYNNILTNSTSLMSFFSYNFNSFFGLILTNFFFLSLSYFGIYYSVIRLRFISKSNLIILLFLLSLPSFGIWTSIISKEAVGVFYMGIILGYFIDLIEDKKRKIRLIEYIAFYLLFVFKIQYLAAIFSLWLYIKFSYFFNLKFFGKSMLLFLHILLSICFFYYFKDEINSISFLLPEHFSIDGGSTRENTIWINDYDVFWNAPYGMFIAFWGPTFSDIIKSPILIIVFIESLIIFLFFMYFIYSIFRLSLKIGKLNIFYFSIFFITLFWLLFAHYPFGILNPGSAIRYRENFYGFLLILIFFLFQKINRKGYTCVE